MGDQCALARAFLIGDLPVKFKDGRFALIDEPKPCHKYSCGCVCGRCDPSKAKPKVVKQPWDLAA